MNLKLLHFCGLFLFTVCVSNWGLSQTTIRLEKEGGVYLIPCKVNGLPLKFVFDTGASDVTLSMTEALFMLKNGYIAESDFTGKERYQVANGKIEEGYTLILRSIEIGTKNLNNVKASIVMSANAPLLLGQSALSKLGALQFDYEYNTLTIGHKDTTITYYDGATYTGETKNGQFQGQGTYYWADGGRYVGEWSENKRQGQGTMSWANGQKYIGQWWDDELNGQGVMELPNGDKYIGESRNSNRHGQGTMIWSDGTKYIGEWKNNMMHGQGTIDNFMGTKYVGQWMLDKRHGNGSMTNSSGEKYIGEWFNDMMHGQGTQTMVNGEIRTGHWENDSFMGK